MFANRARVLSETRPLLARCRTNKCVFISPCLCIHRQTNRGCGIEAPGEAYLDDDVNFPLSTNRIRSQSNVDAGRLDTPTSSHYLTSIGPLDLWQVHWTGYKTAMGFVFHGSMHIYNSMQ